MNIRPQLGVAPLALAIALAAHVAVFGDEHAFGGRYAEALLALLVAGMVAGLGAGLWQLLEAAGDRAAGRTIFTGSHAGLMLPLAVLAAAMFAGGEALEGAGLHHPLAALACITLSSALVALLCRALARWLAGLVLILLACAERIAPGRIVSLALAPAFCTTSVRCAYSRFSRPPPRR